MHVSQKELSRWVSLDPIPSGDALAMDLTMVGLEVEAVQRIGEGCDDIVVGRIDAIEEHEKADKLVICRVDVGDGRQRQIVCGAKNMKAGDLVPVALPGSQPPAIDFQIGERKVLGVMSEGMLCAEEELGLADKSDGLWILPPDLALGVPIFDAMGLRDTHLEIGLTPNRPDCLSHMGIAREVAAIYGGTLVQLPSEEKLRAKPSTGGSAAAAAVGALIGGLIGGPQGAVVGLGLGALFDSNLSADSQAQQVGDVASLVVHDEGGCPRYVAAVLENVKVGPSPDWLRKRVTAMGMRSINNLVDVTNVVLADIGQPLHVFDLDKLEDGAVVVRRAKAGEKIEAIDHKTYELDERDLVIADASRPVAIAGVMGGAQSEVTETTTRVLLECAYFDPATVRKTSKRLGIHSESSHRFERGIDPAATVRNAAFAMELLLGTQVGNTDLVVRRGILEHNSADLEPTVIEFDAARIPRILGIELAPQVVEAILVSIGTELQAISGGWKVTVPSWRPDLERPVDLIEEVARLYGYDKFESTLPAAIMGSVHQKQAAGHAATIVSRPTLRYIDETRKRLLAAGLHESLSYSFMSLADLDVLGIGAEDPRRTMAAPIANPLTSDFSHMRTTVVPAMLRALEANVAQRATDIGLFEISRWFRSDGEGDTLTILVTGAQTRHFSGDRLWDLAGLKGLLEALTGHAGGRSEWSVPQTLEPYLHPGVQAHWVHDGHELGTVGQLHPRLVADYDLSAPAFVAEIDFAELLGLSKRAQKFAPFPKFPAVTRDFALLYDVDSPFAAIEHSIEELRVSDPAFGELFQGMRVFDVYRGEQVPDGKRSIALQVVYRSAERTLTDEEVTGADDALLGAISLKTGATRR